MIKTNSILEVAKNLRLLAESLEILVNTIDNNHIDEKIFSLRTTKEINNELEVKNTEINSNFPDEKQPTLEEVRAVMADKSRDGHREAVKAIITKYGVDNLSSLNPKYYLDALKEASEL